VRLLLAVASLVALAGCAAFGAPDCGSDWYEVGERDGVLGAPLQHENYAQRCGDALDAVRYREGWRDGNSRRPRAPV
jgi:hypothetical protein